LYKPLAWSKSKLAFVETKFDIFEQKHYTNDRKEFSDYEIYVPHDFNANDISFLKIVKTDKPREDPVRKDDFTNSLQVVGFSQ